MRGKYEANIMKCEDQMDLKFCQLGQWFDGNPNKICLLKTNVFWLFGTKRKNIKQLPYN